MDAELTKSFAFSASFLKGGRAVGVNYVLSVSAPALNEAGERDLEAAVHRELISHLHSHDLSSGVAFLKDVEMEDAALLRSFWTRLSDPLARYKPRRLTLQRDARTVTTLYL